jgi:farnesyl-diphosphate farnesyltransferase
MDDRTFCQTLLKQVSRTFSRPIEMLPGQLETAVTCGYLLCRVVDTVEDHPTLEIEKRDRLYHLFVEVLEGRDTPEAFGSAAAMLGIDDDPEHVLARNLPRVMRVFRALPLSLQEPSVRWITEMARGMAIYSHRSRQEDGLIALTTLADLERYCYFVAGTVGHMLTDLFIAELGGAVTPERTRLLRAHSEEFGLGLQLVNILKDITEDQERGWSFIPRSVCAAYGLGVADLTKPGKRAIAHDALTPVFERARRALDSAFTYSLAIPPDSREVRLFCLLPLWMAVATLDHARHNDDQLTPGRGVKISRPEVERLIRDCLAHCADDDALRESFTNLSQRRALAA